MNNYTIYNPDTGQILSQFSCDDAVTAQLNLQGQTYIEGNYPGNVYYIDQGQAVALPDCPGPGYEFDYTNKIWIANTSQLSFLSRSTRDQLLSAVDRVNPVWYASLTADQQQELVAYRQALLDVPQQAGFPTEIEWPAKPTWL
jgi:hypothetical protein